MLLNNAYNYLNKANVFSDASYDQCYEQMSSYAMQARDYAFEATKAAVNNLWNAASDFLQEATVDAVALLAATLIVAPFLPPGESSIDEITDFAADTTQVCRSLKAVEVMFKNTFSGETVDKVVVFIQYVKAYIFAEYLSRTVGTLIHELGHKACAALVYKGEVLTYVISKGGGKSCLTDLTLHGIGHLLGPAKSELLWTVGGPFADVAVTVASLAYYHFKNQETPKTAKVALMVCVQTAFDSFLYAQSAIGKTDNPGSHDYAIIAAATGISPIAMCLFWVALPFITKVALDHIYPRNEGE